LTDDRANGPRVLPILFLGVLMGALDIAIVGPALRSLGATFGVGTRGQSAVFSVYVLFALLGTPVMAKLSDRRGRRSVYVADVALFGAGSAIVALAPSFVVLLAGRAVQGFAAGGVFPVAAAVIGDTFPPERRGRALGLVGAVFGIAFLVGPVLGGVILRFLGWRWLFVVNLPMALYVCAAAWRTLPSAGRTGVPRADVAGTALLLAALGSLALGLTALGGGEKGVSPLPAWPFLAVAPALAFVFWQAEKRAVDPILHPALLRPRRMVLVSLLAVGAGVAETGSVFLPGLAVESLHVTPHAASFLLLSVVAAMAIGSPLAGRMLDRAGARPVVVAGVALTAVGAALYAGPWTGMLWFHGSGVLVGLGLSALLGAPLRYVALEEAPARERASAQGALVLFTGVGQLSGSAAVGSLAALRGGGLEGYRFAFGVVAVALALLLPAAAGLGPRRREAQVRERAAG